MIRHRVFFIAMAVLFAFSLSGLQGDASGQYGIALPLAPPSLALVFQCDPAMDPECNLPPPDNSEGQPPSEAPEEPPSQEGKISDRDQDGIPDDDDACPDTFGRKPDGCPIGRDNDTQGAASQVVGAVVVVRNDGPMSEEALTTARQRCLTINEVLWTGTGFSRNHQYIELRNRCDVQVDLNGVRLNLVSNDETVQVLDTIQLQGNIASQGYYLIVNNNLVVSDIQPDLVTRFSLQDAGMALLLGDDGGNEFSTANFDPGFNAWFAGEQARDGTTRSMERNERTSSIADIPENWHSNDGRTRFGLDAVGDPINGTPRKPNSPGDA